MTEERERVRPPEVEDLLRRMEELRRLAGEDPGQMARLALGAFEEVETALEELRVADEELQEAQELLAARQELEDERRRYRELFELAPDGYLVTDLLGMIRDANRAAGDLLGLSPERLAGKPLALFASREGKGEFRARLARVAQAVRSERWELRLQPRRGESFIASATVAVTRDAAGKAVGLRWLFRDVTREKRLEAEGRESERLQTLADAMPQLVWTARSGGGVDYCNSRLEEYAPISRREDGSWDWGPLLHPEDRERTERAWEAATAAGEVYQVEHRVKLRDGRYRWHLTRAVPSRDDLGRIAKWFGTSTDIGALKDSEEELRRARDAAEAAAEAKSQFLANMSHEIRTPLGGVLGMAEILAGTALSPEQRECVDAIRLSGKLLLGIVNDVLDLSRIESAGVTLESVEFTLRNALEDTVHLQAEAAHAKGLELCCLVGRRVPARVVGDPGRFRQILFNLVGNAVKFTDRGQVVVRAEVAEGDEEGQATAIRVEVEDTGVGIPEAEQPRLFQNFTQGDASATRRFGGSGLGLAISKRLVGAMGGKIGFRSVWGRGSTFWFTVPFAVTAGPPEEEAFLAGTRALAVVPHPVSRSFLMEQLVRMGADTVGAADGAEASRVLLQAGGEDRPFGLVLVEMDLPDGSGLALIRDLQDRAGRPGPGAVLLAPFTSRGVAAKAQQEDGTCFVLKPVREPDLVQCIAAVAAGNGHPASETKRRADARMGTGTGERGTVLLAEDNPVNQVVVTRFLERLGYRADVVEDGAAAVEAALSSPYALVLMDWQMPGMDGLAAAREIRRREGPSRRVPIVALTAHALDAHRESCLEAGMDDYLSKPVELPELARIVTRWAEAKDLGAGGEEPPASTGFDRVERRLAEFGGRLAPGVVQGLVDLFLEEAAVGLAELREAARRAEPGAVAREAHKLRGTCCHLGTERILEVAADLERRAEGGNLDGAEERVADLAEELARIHSFLAARRPAPEE